MGRQRPFDTGNLIPPVLPPVRVRLALIAVFSRRRGLRAVRFVPRASL